MNKDKETQELLDSGFISIVEQVDKNGVTKKGYFVYENTENGQETKFVEVKGLSD